MSDDPVRSEYTNGEVKALLATLFHLEPEEMQGYIVLTLTSDGGIPMMSSAAHSMAGRQAEIMLLLGALAEITRIVTLEGINYRNVLETLNLLPKDDE
jgi:hypothetical protein